MQRDRARFAAPRCRSSPPFAAKLRTAALAARSFHALNPCTNVPSAVQLWTRCRSSCVTMQQDRTDDRSAGGTCRRVAVCPLEERHLDLRVRQTAAASAAAAPAVAAATAPGPRPCIRTCRARQDAAAAAQVMRSAEPRSTGGKASCGGSRGDRDLDHGAPSWQSAWHHKANAAAWARTCKRQSLCRRERVGRSGRG